MKINRIGTDPRLNLLSFIKFDEASYLAVTKNQIVVTNLGRDNTAYLYRDYGAAYFSAWVVDFEVTISTSSTTNGYVRVGFANIVGDGCDWVDALDFAAVCIYTLKSPDYIFVGVQSPWDAGSTAAVACGTCYIRFVRAIGSLGTLTVYIYSDVNRTVLVDTLTCDITPGNTYRYFYPIASNDYGAAGGNDFSGILANHILK